MKKTIQAITREDIKWQVFLIGFFMSIVVWAVRIESHVSANEKDISGNIEKLDQIIKDLDVIENNQIRLMERFGVAPVRENSK